MQRRNRTLLPLTLASTAAFAALALAGRHLPAHRLLFVCFYLYAVMLPGYLAARLAAPRVTGTPRLLASFVFGTALAFAVLLIAAVFRLDIRILGVAAPVLAVSLAAWERSRGRDEAGEANDGEPMPREGTWTRIVLIGILIAVALLILFGGDPLLYSSDSADHIAYIRTVARTHEAFPREFYYRNGGITTHDIRKGLGQSLFGALMAMSGDRDADVFWPLMCLVSSLSLIVAFYCAGILLFENASIGIVTAILFILFHGGGLRSYGLATSAGGYTFGRAFYVAAFAILPRCLARPRCANLPLLIAAAFAAVCSHFTYFALIVFVTGAFTLSNAIAGRGRERINAVRRGLVVGAMIILVSAPYLALRYFRDYAPANPIHTDVQGVLYLTPRLYTLNPIVFFEDAGPLGALAVLSVFILFRRSRSNDRLRPLIDGLIAVYVLVFNPLWFPYLLGKLSYLLMRFEFAIPSKVVSAYLLYEIWGALRRRVQGLSRIETAVGIAAVIALLGYPLAKTPSNFAYGAPALRRANAMGYRELDDLFTFIRRECPAGSSIAADPITSFGIPAFTDAYAICPYDQHSTPNDTTAVRRLRDCRQIFNPTTTLQEIRDLMQKYDASYLIVNGRIPRSVPRLYWGIDGNGARELGARMRAPESTLRIVFDRAECTVARLGEYVTREAIRGRPAPPSFVGDSVSLGVAEELSPSGIPEIRIGEVRPSRTEAARGDTVDVDIAWIATKSSPFSSYVAHLRFDTSVPKNALYRSSFGKVYRKTYQKIVGYRFRFRIDFQPLGGLDPPDVWPPLHSINDRVRVVIPRDIAPGDYAISLRMARETQYPNFMLRDIFGDDDFYSGAKVGSIRIQ
jgi:hypothetical protein